MRSTVLLLFFGLVALASAAKSALQPDTHPRFARQKPSFDDLPEKPADAGAGTPVVVKVNCVLKSLYKVAENQGTLGVQVMVQLVWTDPAQTTGTDAGVLLKPGDVMDPNLQFLNGLHVEVRKEKIMGYANGEVRKTKRVFLTVQEKMNYAYYPFDSHMWSIQFNSFTDTSDKLIFVPGKLTVDPNFKSGLFNFGKAKMSIQTLPAPLFPGQSYSTVQVGIIAQRRVAYCAENIIFPLCVVIALAWLSFWISPDAMPARVALCIVSILTVLVINGTVSSMLPKISYSTWIDIFLTFSLFTVASCSFTTVAAHRVSINKSEKWFVGDVNAIDYYGRMAFPIFFASFFVGAIIVGATLSPSEADLLHDLVTGTPA